MREALTGEQKAKEARQRASKGEQVERIGSFRVEKMLGKGAMGQVFQGTGPNGEVVAIKVLHQRFSKSKRVKARFVREAKAVERIQHPNVVRFFETGEEPGLGQYIAMEFVDGDAMNDMIKKNGGKPFSVEQALDFFVQTCKGMRAAHAAGVIHRDLKPENVLVSRRGEVKITDFSLARRDQDSMLLTRPGQVMGTPHFMSPEQARGETVDARTDIYSLGAMLYTMLTGKFPFPNGTVSEVIAAHCEKERPNPRDHNKEVPSRLAAMVRKLMAIDRNERYQTVEAILDELNEIYGFETEDDEAIVGALPPGTRVDEFTIEKVLGAGGMGAVYQAKTTAGPVALKILPPEPGRPPQERLRDVRRFHNEAKIARRVKSPNVYRIVKFGVDQNGQAFIAMSLEEGVSLAKLVSKRGFLSPDLIRKVARGMCEALHAIHAAKIVHRDITPANVILRGDYENAADANVCLIDFGLAIPMEREKKEGALEGSAIKLGHIAKKADDSVLDLDEDSLYLEDLPGGTPAYMAPEVLEDPSLVDGRADLYGLGATLYHAATGHPPYTGETIQQVIYQQRSQPPAPITQFNADFPEELSELILQLLGNHPNFRPKSAKLCLSKLARLEDPGAIAAFKVESAPQLPPMAVATSKEVIKTAPSVPTFVAGILAGAVLTVGTLLTLPHVGVRLPALARMLDPGARAAGPAGSGGAASDEDEFDEEALDEAVGGGGAGGR
ncbi:MAG: serine/threonine protein kinase [Planctomycetota bacterium]|nr:MAG: serine/threonine protein kinase [Planctomycetota bacterium]